MQGTLVDQYPAVPAARPIAQIESSAANAPYLLPHIRELRPTSAVDYGCGDSRFCEVLRHAGVTRVARYDRTIPAFSRRPQGFYDLLLSIDVLHRVAAEELDAVISEMARLARQAIIVVDTDGDTPERHRPLEWWQSKLQHFFPYLEPIRVRSRGHAAFRTWPTKASARPKLWLTFFTEERRYRLAKLGFSRA